MQNGINVPLSYRMPTERLNTSSCTIDKEKSFSEKSGLTGYILDDLASIDIPERHSNRYQRYYVEPPPSNSKNYQSASKEPIEYIFAENHSSIYYTENLSGDESNRQFDSESVKQYQSKDEDKEGKEYTIEYKKSLSSLNKSEQQSRNVSINNMMTKEKIDQGDPFEDRSLCVLEKDSLSNGVIIDPIRVYEEKPFIVVSVLNDIPCHKKGEQEVSSSVITTNTSLTSGSKKGDDSLIFERCQEEIKQSQMQISGLQNLKNQVSDFVNSLNQHRFSQQEVERENLGTIEEPPSLNDEYVSQEGINESVEQEPENEGLFRKKACASLGKATEDALYIKKKEELDRMNRQLLEDDTNSENVGENAQNHPLMKKTLSVIFSTNESIDTNSYRGSAKNLAAQAYMKESDHCFQSQVRTNSRTLMTQDSDMLKNKETPPILLERAGFMTMTTLSGGGNDEENFMSLAQMMKFQNKDNKDLVEKISKLIEIYNKQIEKYEVNNSLLIEKNKKYSHGNELLIKTLKAFEKEMDKLALNNQTLHKNIIFLQEEIKGYEVKEKSLKDLYHQQEANMAKLKEELKFKISETEDLKRKLVLSTTRIENLCSTTQSCEESILLVNQVLKDALTQKKSKITSKSLYTTLETIYMAISKFVDHLEPKLKIDDSQSTSLGSRKNSDITRLDESLGFNENELLSTRRDYPLSKCAGDKAFQDLRPTKNISRSIDLSSSRGYSHHGLFSHREVTNRHRQHSLAESCLLTKEERYNSGRGLSARGRTRQTSLERMKQRTDRSAPTRDNQHNNKHPIRTNKYALDADVEENLRKRLIDNIKGKDNKHK